MPVDLSQDLAEPDWVIRGALEAGTVSVLAAESGAAKSLLMQDLTVAVARGRESSWLGKVSKPGPVIYLDGENHERLVVHRLRALGAAPSDPIYYLADESIVLSAGGYCPYTQRLMDRIVSMSPSLVVIDTASSSLGCEVNNNDQVQAVYRDCLIPLAKAGRGTALVVLHHERKPSAREGRGDPKQAVMGAVAWRNRSTAMFSIGLDGSGVREKDIGDGLVERRFTVLASQVKNRNGSQWEREVTINSTGPADDQATKLWVT